RYGMPLSVHLSGLVDHSMPEAMQDLSPVKGDLQKRDISRLYPRELSGFPELGRVLDFDDESRSSSQLQNPLGGGIQFSFIGGKAHLFARQTSGTAIPLPARSHGIE